MSAAKHTPGPWFMPTPGSTSRLYVGPLVVQSHRTAFPDSIQNLQHISDDELYANARLIAAAPELLRVMELVADGLDSDGRTLDGMTKATAAKKLRAAIAKAEGRE